MVSTYVYLVLVSPVLLLKPVLVRFVSSCSPGQNPAGQQRVEKRLIDYELQQKRDSVLGCHLNPNLSGCNLLPAQRGTHKKIKQESIHSK